MRRNWILACLFVPPGKRGWVIRPRPGRPARWCFVTAISSAIVPARQVDCDAMETRIGRATHLSGALRVRRKPCIIPPQLRLGACAGKAWQRARGGGGERLVVPRAAPRAGAWPWPRATIGAGPAGASPVATGCALGTRHLPATRLEQQQFRRISFPTGRYFILTIGCQMNKADSERVAWHARGAGLGARHRAWRMSAWWS